MAECIRKLFFKFLTDGNKQTSVFMISLSCCGWIIMASVMLNNESSDLQKPTGL